MKEKVRFLGLDVHAETIAVAIAEPDGAVRSLGTIANREESILKLIKKLGPVERLRACYEAGPTGYVLYWQLVELGVECAVIAPTLVPMKAGDRVKTDRRDALKLARSHRSGDLTSVWVPNGDSEALRDLVRARHRLSKFLLRAGQRPAQGVKAWTLSYLTWVRQIRFTQVAQESTRLSSQPKAAAATGVEGPAFLFGFSPNPRLNLPKLRAASACRNILQSPPASCPWFPAGISPRSADRTRCIPRTERRSSNTRTC